MKLIHTVRAKMGGSKETTVVRISVKDVNVKVNLTDEAYNLHLNGNIRR